MPHSAVSLAGRASLCRLALVAALAAATLLLTAPPADAFPYFARRYDVTCHTCHSVVPELNAVGLAFRENGYRMERSSRSTIPFAGGGAVRYENRSADGVDEAYLKVVKIASGGSIGQRASFVVKWHAVDRTMNRNGRLVDRSGVFEDLFLNMDLSDAVRLTVGQFRVFNQFDASRQLSASPPLALAMGVDGERGGTARQTDLRRFVPARRTPAVMLSYRGSDSSQRSTADGFFLHASVPFTGEFAVPSTKEAGRNIGFDLDARPKGVVLESYTRQELRTIGGSAFLDTNRQLYTGMLSFDPGRWASSFVYSQAVREDDRTRQVSWWGEYRPSNRSNLGVRVDDPGSWIEATVYGDYQWFTERAMVWFLVEQRIGADLYRTIAQVKLVF